MALRSKKKLISTVDNQESVADLAAEALANLDVFEEGPAMIDQGNGDVRVDTDIFLQEDVRGAGFLPEVPDDDGFQFSEIPPRIDLENSELSQFEAAEIDEVNFIESERAESIVESILFASDRPVSLASIVDVFKGTNIKKNHVRQLIDDLAVEYAGGKRGVALEEVTGGYQIRTKVDNMNFIKSTVKARAFKLSGPALETLAIVAYKQPVVKSEIDQIRGVESGHLLRALMEKGLCNFEGKADNLPGRPMQYGTTRRFLEIFGLRNIKELPTLSQIDELLPEGITEEEAKPTLSMVTDSLSENVTDVSYSQGEEELGKIENELSDISVSSEFFEQEKLRQKIKKDADKAQDIREALAVGEDVSTRDRNWLAKHELNLTLPPQASADTESATADVSVAEPRESLNARPFSDQEAEDDEDELPFYDEADDDGTSEQNA